MNSRRLTIPSTKPSQTCVENSLAQINAAMALRSDDSLSGRFARALRESRYLLPQFALQWTYDSCHRLLLLQGQQTVTGLKGSLHACEIRTDPTTITRGALDKIFLIEWSELLIPAHSLAEIMIHGTAMYLAP